MALYLKQILYFYTVIILSLLLPVSFTLLASLSNAEYHLTFINSEPSSPNSSLLYLFLYSKPPLLHSLLFIITLGILLQSLTGHLLAGLFQPRINAAWILLCTVQVCVALGVTGIISSGGVWPIDYKVKNGMFTLFNRTFFFIGLHEAMLHWSKTIVRPVVDDSTLFGAAMEETWIERVAMGVGFGALWWKSLRDNIGSLVLLVEIKTEVSMDLGLIDILSWWLYNLVVAIGIVRLVKGIIWFGNVLLCRAAKGNVVKYPVVN